MVLKEFIAGKLYKVCYDEANFNSISDYSTIILKRNHIVLYLGNGDTMKLKVFGIESNLFFNKEAQFFLIGNKIYFENINYILYCLEEIQT